MGRGTSWITDVFDKAESFDEMVAVMGGDAPAGKAGARTEHVDALTALGNSSWSETGVVVGVHWLMAFLKRMEERVAALEAELAPPHRTRK